MNWFIVGGGAFALCSAVLDWDWFMNHRKAQAFVRLWGRGGARIFYGILGTALIVLGVLMATGVIEDAR